MWIDHLVEGGNVRISYIRHGDILKDILILFPENSFLFFFLAIYSLLRYSVQIEIIQKHDRREKKKDANIFQYYIFREYVLNVAMT